MTIFYIAPHYFDSGFDAKYQILKRIASKYNVNILKGIKKNKGAFDINKTMQLYEKADCFIADLSFERPSCYYEVGYVQGLGKLVKLIAFANTHIHQVKGEVKSYASIDEYEQLIGSLISELVDYDSLKKRL